MNKALKYIVFIVIFMGLYSGVRYIGTTIHYGCHRVPLTNVDGGDDCAPPIWAVGQLGFYLTGGPLMPLWNRDTITVSKVSWSIEKADPSITNPDDFHFYKQKIAADVTTYDGKTKRYDLGTAYGCTGSETSEIEEKHGIVIGRVKCDFAESGPPRVDERLRVEAGTTFVAFGPHGHFKIERYDESAKDGSIKTTVLVEIKVPKKRPRGKPRGYRKT